MKMCELQKYNKNVNIPLLNCIVIYCVRMLVFTNVFRWKMITYLFDRNKHVCYMRGWIGGRKFPVPAPLSHFPPPSPSPDPHPLCSDSRPVPRIQITTLIE